MMMSPYSYVYENIKWKKKDEIKREIEKLKRQIKDLQQKVDNNKKCVTKPDYNTQLSVYKSYYNYIVPFFIENVIFDLHNEKDPFWVQCVREFVLAVVDLEFKEANLKEVLDYFIVDGDNSKLESFEKFEHFKKYDKDAINKLLDNPQKTKLSYFKVMQDKFKKYAEQFDSDEQYPYSFKQLENKELKQKEITYVVEKQVRNLPTNTKFCFADFLKKYELDKNEQLKYAIEFITTLNNYVLPISEDISGLPQSLPVVRINVNDYFKKLDYDFYLYHSLEGFECKLSPKNFAAKTRDNGLIILNKSPEELNNLWNEFLEFVKTAKPYIPYKPKRGVKTGVTIEEHWAKKLKYIFKKLPDYYEAITYLKNIFHNKENMGNMSLDVKAKQQLASKLLNVNVDIIEKASTEIDDILVVMLTNENTPISKGYKGGYYLLVGNDGGILYCSSSAYDVKQLLKEYKNGKRTPIESFKK